MTVGILSERRACQPYGIDGGGPGSRGVNLLVKKGGRLVNMGGKCIVDVQPWDRIRILTPGGGGYGVVGSNPHSRARSSVAAADEVQSGSLAPSASIGHGVIVIEAPAAAIDGTSVPVTLSATAAGIPRAAGSVHAYKSTQDTV